jgi:hypothetical protein
MNPEARSVELRRQGLKRLSKASFLREVGKLGYTIKRRRKANHGYYMAYVIEYEHIVSKKSPNKWQLGYKELEQLRNKHYIYTHNYIWEL